MSLRDTAVYITNFNNLSRGFTELVCWLVQAGMHNITILDNGSTLPDLLAYYRQTTLPVLLMGRNAGPYALWEAGVDLKNRFILTDADVVPDLDCPIDLVEKLHLVMDQHSAIKVGPGLRIDDLPDGYEHKARVVEWEAQFWRERTADGAAYVADIDTTFALHAAGSEHYTEGPRLRLAAPYLARHIPWYEDSRRAHAERDFYHATARRDWIHW